MSYTLKRNLFCQVSVSSIFKSTLCPMAVSYNLPGLAAWKRHISKWNWMLASQWEASQRSDLCPALLATQSVQLGNMVMYNTKPQAVTILYRRLALNVCFFFFPLVYLSYRCCQTHCILVLTLGDCSAANPVVLKMYNTQGGTMGL